MPASSGSQSRIGAGSSSTMLMTPRNGLSRAATTAVAASCAWMNENTASPPPTTGTLPARTCSTNDPSVAYELAGSVEVPEAQHGRVHVARPALVLDDCLGHRPELPRAVDPQRLVLVGQRSPGRPVGVRQALDDEPGVRGRRDEVGDGDCDLPPLTAALPSRSDEFDHLVTDLGQQRYDLPPDHARRAGDQNLHDDVPIVVSRTSPA